MKFPDINIDKRKMAIGSVVTFVLAFTAAYYFYLQERAAQKKVPIEQPQVPKAEAGPKEYDSRLEAVDAIEEPRREVTTKLYQETSRDSLEIQERESEIIRERIVDSIYRRSRQAYKKNVLDHQTSSPRKERRKRNQPSGTASYLERPAPDFQAQHQAFFASQDGVFTPSAGMSFLAAVNGQQSVGANERLELRLLEPLKIENLQLPKHSLVYGRVTFQANRVFVDITIRGNEHIHLKGFDRQDGREGIFIINSYRQEAGREVLDDAAGSISVPGLPQLRGIQQVFRRSNRRVKVTIHDQYLLYLRP